jgi:hypothetical protein
VKNETMLYKAPGPHELHGGNFDYIIVDANEPGAMDAAKEAGWFETTTEAKEALTLVEVAKVEVPADNLPPTRLELEQKAHELSVKFNDKTSDKKLGELISAALGG